MNPATMLTPSQASTWLREHGYPLAVPTLASYRTRRRGPAYVKRGHWVLYPVAELESWLRAQYTLITPSTSTAE